jgi:hypothetical protein
VEVTDLANNGAGIYMQGLAILPLPFELSLDNLRRRCRMVWRRGNFLGVTFEGQASPALDPPEVGEAGFAIEELTFSLLSDPSQLACSDSEAITEFAPTIGVPNNGGPSDIRFAVGVAVALAMPVLISVGAYIAMTVVLRTG